MKWIIKLAIFACFFFITARFCKAETGKFTVLRITSNLTYHPEWETASLSPAQEDEIKTLLNQPYTYLNKGVQSFVFASEDGRYVIKFFRHDHLSPPFWSKLLPGKDRKLAQKYTRLSRDFLS